MQDRHDSKTDISFPLTYEFLIFRIRFEIPDLSMVSFLTIYLIFPPQDGPFWSTASGSRMHACIGLYGRDRYRQAVVSRAALWMSAFQRVPDVHASARHPDELSTSKNAAQNDLSKTQSAGLRSSSQPLLHVPVRLSQGDVLNWLMNWFKSSWYAWELICIFLNLRTLLFFCLETVLTVCQAECIGILLKLSLIITAGTVKQS